MALRTPLSVTPHLYMGDSTGRPLDMGTVYFGEQDKDPEFYPINLFSDDELTKPLAQPVHTKGGYLYDKGDMVEPHAKELIYSVKVLDSYGRKVFYKGAMMRNSWNDDVIEQINQAVIGSADVARQVATDITNDAINSTAVAGGVIADTFVTATAKGIGTIARTQRELNNETFSAKDFGAIGDGRLHTVAEWLVVGSRIYFESLAAIQVVYPHVTALTDSIDWAAIQLGVSVARNIKLPNSGAFVINKSIVLAAESALIGDSGSKSTIRVAMEDFAIRLHTGSTVKNIETRYFSLDFRLKYSGVCIDSSLIPWGAQRNIIDNVMIYSPKIGFLVDGAAYYNQLKAISVYSFSDYGIWINAGGNGNSFEIQQMSCAAPRGADGNFDFTNQMDTQAGIRVVGHQNIFTTGQCTPARYGVYVDDGSTGNIFNGMYMENTQYSLRAGKNSQTFWNSSLMLGETDIHESAEVYGYSGLKYSFNHHIPTRPLRFSKGLTAAWYFNEGEGNTVYDHSGNGNDITFTNPRWTGETRWCNNGLTFSKTESKTVSVMTPIPITQLKMDKPFTVIAGYTINNDGSGSNIWSIQTPRNQSHYLAFTDYRSYFSVLERIVDNVTTFAFTGMQPSSVDRHKWMAYYVDPILGTISCMDITRKEVMLVKGGSLPGKSEVLTMSPYVKNAEDGTELLFNIGATRDSSFSPAFMGVWEGKITMPEISDLYNMKYPDVAKGIPKKKLSMPDASVATSVEELKDDYNTLIAALKNVML